MTFLEFIYPVLLFGFALCAGWGLALLGFCCMPALFEWVSDAFSSIRRKVKTKKL